ncbi:protein SMG5 isoform X2 [Cephus cinctus]|uniref:Protein SMG5 isoform X2 n=1 Tax=Cephus cinctus TaxID=211228 RepID=A0AAJ7C416_CEPCN|nr:protein SMG5 isoform X2 [Cephus cinctus]XP_015601438.1 protein SMG5 isoform X2 [Cephus cinctus]
MRRTCNTAAEAKTTDCLEIAKRLYRGVTDIAKRLDQQKNQITSVVEIFESANETLRVKLRDYCERLIFKDPIGHGRKTEELLWRRGFYDAVAMAKRLRKGNAWNDTEKALLSTHLAVGVGFYHHLILKLQLEFGLDLYGAIDFTYPDCEREMSNHLRKVVQPKLQSEEVKQCAIRLVHRSLICLGDLARYRLDLDSSWDPLVAVRYYKMAIAIDPNIGMPHNQLGTLAGSTNYGLDAAYHYIRCTLCSEPFDGAEGNLKRTIAMYSYDGGNGNSPRRCAGRMLSLLQLWESGNVNLDRINRECQDLLNEIENCLTEDRNTKKNSAAILNADTVECYLENCKNGEQPAHLTDDMIFKIVAICLMSISKVQDRNSSQAQGIVAFVLAVLSQLLQVATTSLQKLIAGVSAPQVTTSLDANPPVPKESSPVEGADNIHDRDKPIDAENTKVMVESCNKESVDLNDNKESCDDKETGENVETVESLSNGIKKTVRDRSKCLLTKLRRPRRRRNSSDSDVSDGEGAMAESSSDEVNSDISETEEDVPSEGNPLSDDGLSEDLTEDEATLATDSNLPIILAAAEEAVGVAGCKERSEDSTKCERGMPYNKTETQPEDEESITNFSSTIIVTTSTDSNKTYNGSSCNSANILPCALKKEAPNPNDILEHLIGDGILASIKISYDWLRCNPDIVRACAKSSDTVLRRSIALLNQINMDITELSRNWKRENSLMLLLDRSTELALTVPLPEDTDLRGLKILKDSQKTLDWKILHRNKMTKHEETLLRVLKLIEFGRYISSVQGSGIEFDESTKTFIMVGLESVPVTPNDISKDIREPGQEHPRGTLMRHMGKLWLKAEVRALESRLRSKLMSPYLVPDHEALAKHTSSLKRLFYAKEFIVVIPSVVVSALDEVKRTSGRAREATRWLETQLKRGSRFLRAQRPHERLPLPLIKGPRPKDKEAWLYFQIVECCHYLTQQTKVGLNGDTETPVVTLLTGCSIEEKKSLSFSPVGLAKSAGVRLEHVEGFHTKWKASRKSHG